MSYFISRAKGLFQYGDLNGESRVSTDGHSIDIEETGILSANAKVRRSRRCVWIGSILSIVLATVIIAVAVKNRHHLKAAADALMQSVENSQATAAAATSGAVEPVAGQRQTANQFTFNDYLRFSYYPGFFNGTWISDTEVIFRDMFGGISLTNVETSETQTVVSHNQAINLTPVSYAFSADREYLLIQTQSQKVWRRSSFGSYSLVKLSGGRPSSVVLPLLPPHATGEEDDIHQYIRYVTWAPAGNAIAYVDFENNIHYRHSAEAEDVRLTTTGNDTVIYNGIPDWVNEEEVFEDNKALYWSPDGSKLVYGVFNDTLVEIVKLPRYGNWRTDNLNQQGYPFLQYYLQDDFRYPKVSSPNPGVTVWVADVGPPGVSSSIKQQNLPPPLSMMEEEHHFTFVRWAANDSVAVNWMNRIQNKTAVNLCQLTGDVRCEEVFIMPQRDGWVDYKFDITFNKYRPGKRFLTVLPAANMVHRLHQLFLVDVEKNTRTQLTRAQSEVTQILEWTKEDTVYYIATAENEPGSRQLYKLEMGQPEPVCLTCHQQEMAPQIQHRPQCEYVSVQMSTEGSYYVMDCKGPGIPYSCLHHTATNTLISFWTENTNLENRFSLLDTSTVKYMKVPVPGSDQAANVVVFIPSAVQTQPGKKFPMLVDVYGGPGWQYVDKQWAGYDYPTFMSSALDVVYVKIDPRGSGFQGDAWTHSVYRNFGSVEVSDTIHVTKYLQDHLGYVDLNRTAIWGWSYGGFLSLSALGKDTGNVFSCGASVAPVVRWELYDTYYTERYMSTFEDNVEGYNNSSPLNFINNLKFKKYMLIHGTHDDNVHYQQSMLLSAALEESDILFRQQSYPDQDHSMGDYKRHLYHSLTSFIMQDCFNTPVQL